MLNIVIEEKDALYRQGMEKLLEQIFSIDMGREVTMENLDSSSVVTADVIVKRYEVGTNFICQPMFRKRKPSSLIIGVLEGSEFSNSVALPLCISNVVFVNRVETVGKTKEIIMGGWEHRLEASLEYSQFNCFSCHHRTLTSQQLLVAAHFYCGHNLQQTADILNISPKTVGAHKYMIMSNFNLHTDHQLLNFLNVFLQGKYASLRFNNNLDVKRTRHVIPTAVV